MIFFPPMYKEPLINENGKPICEICKVGYDRLLRHVSHRHGMNAAEYKKTFGYHPRKGIVSAKVARKARENALKNFDTSIMRNLIIGGQKTRFEDGNTATDRELVSKVAALRMKAYWESKKETKQQRFSRLIGLLESGKDAL